MVSLAAPLEAYEYCRRITREAAGNFYYAFVTLPRRRRRAMYAAYAYCRLCDDLSDDDLPIDEKTRQIQGIDGLLEQARAGNPDGPVFEALAHAAAEYDIPYEDLMEVARGVEMDLTISRYETFEDLKTYCYRVASVVGLICIQIMGYRDQRAREYAIDLGLAMQLTNILRDIREDAERGRIYIPQEDLRRFGYSEEDLMAGTVNDQFRSLMEFEVARAREYFERGKRLLKLLPVRTRAFPAVLGGLYGRVLDRIEARNYNVFEGRVGLSTREKVGLAVRLWIQSYIPMERVATAW
ncbi:MAG: presqualene diphosphate synthase HpnD [Dehalococcoidia bacterium]|nr:presqualene diphosphate synthase HpnD [Dehalococcoidia bacterium]